MDIELFGVNIDWLFVGLIVATVVAHIIAKHS